MALRLPNDTDSTWSQPNTSDKFGSLAASKNINLDERGYIKLSPRTIVIADEDDNPEFNIPVAIGRHGESDYLVAGTAENFNVNTGTITLTVAENDGIGQPNLSNSSHAIFWKNLWVVSTSTTVETRGIGSSDSSPWTEQITGLTSGVRHALRVFESNDSLAVTDANVVRQYDNTFTPTTNLTIPSDFEAIGLAYNANRMGVITRLGGSTEGQGRDAYFFVWDGSTAAANSAVAIGAPSAVGICAYKSSFALLTQLGQLLYWNGGGLEELASLPFYFTKNAWGDLLNQEGFGDIMVVDGDRIHLNLGLELERFGRKEERVLPAAPSGVWTYEPKVGLYHRLSGTNSKAYLLDENSVDTLTDTITLASGTIPESGNPVRYTFASTEIGGLEVNQDYYVIKVSSTTLKLATTKQNALDGTAIDLTSVGSNSYFWAYDLKDYGNSYYDQFGTVAMTRLQNVLSGQFLFGGSFADTDLADKDSLCMAVPYLENRGYFITPKIFPKAVEDNTQPFVLKYRPLATGDAIVVKVRDKNVAGLPVSSTGTGGGTWTAANRLYIAEDLSAAKEHLDGGGKIEMEIISGAGGGTLAQVASIEGDASLYDLILEEDVLGASNGRKCHFILDNWREIQTITASSDGGVGYTEVPVEEKGKWVQFKVELRGSETCIEEVQMESAVHKK